MSMGITCGGIGEFPMTIGLGQGIDDGDDDDLLAVHTIKRKLQWPKRGTNRGCQGL